jgi:hypothetical protein
MIVAWTGHRPDIFCDPSAGRAAIDAAARELARDVEYFLVGGQRGVDTWAAMAAIELGVPFTLVLPMPVYAFTRDWSAEDRQVLQDTLARADEVRVAAGYTERNRQLATGAHLLVAVWTRLSGGGTAQTIRLARAAGTPVREIVLEPSPSAASARGRGL